jgi:hypothetical protein
MKSVWNVYYWLTETCAKSSAFTIVMYVEISTNENMAFQRNKLFFKKSTSHGKSSNIYTLNNQPNNSYTFMIKVKKKFG